MDRTTGPRTTGARTTARRRPVRRIALAATLVLLLVGGDLRPAAALFDGSKAYGFGQLSTCGSDGTYGYVDLRAFLKEYGDSKVSRFGVVFKLYKTETTAGWNYADRQKSYASGWFPSDGASYEVWLPAQPHRWSEITVGVPRRIDAKLTWARQWRRDFNYTVTIRDQFDVGTCAR